MLPTSSLLVIDVSSVDKANLCSISGEDLSLKYFSVNVDKEVFASFVASFVVVVDTSKIDRAERVVRLRDRLRDR